MSHSATPTSSYLAGQPRKKHHKWQPQVRLERAGARPQTVCDSLLEASLLEASLLEASHLKASLLEASFFEASLLPPRGQPPR